MARENPSLVRHVEPEFGKDLRALQEIAPRVAELAMLPGWEAIMKVLDAEAEALSAAMNRHKDTMKRAEYAYRHGRISGLKAAAEAIPSILAVVDRREKAAREAVDATAGGT